MLNITLVPSSVETANTFAATLRATLHSVEPPLLTADAVSRYVSGLENPRVRAHTTSDTCVDVEMRVLGEEWVDILQVNVR